MNITLGWWLFPAALFLLGLLIPSYLFRDDYPDTYGFTTFISGLIMLGFWLAAICTLLVILCKG